MKIDPQRLNPDILNTLAVKAECMRVGLEVFDMEIAMCLGWYQTHDTGGTSTEWYPPKGWEGAVPKQGHAAHGYHLPRFSRSLDAPRALVKGWFMAGGDISGDGLPYISLSRLTDKGNDHVHSIGATLELAYLGAALRALALEAKESTHG